jgi:hypothetical protein
MFTRHISMKLKANSAPELTRIIENEIIPVLRKQQGFRDEVTFIDQGRSEVLAISFWDTKESAESYNSTAYPEVLKILAKVTEGAPVVRTFELSNSTFHKLAAKAV